MPWLPFFIFFFFFISGAFSDASIYLRVHVILLGCTPARNNATGMGRTDDSTIGTTSCASTTLGTVSTGCATMKTLSIADGLLL